MKIITSLIAFSLLSVAIGDAAENLSTRIPGLTDRASAITSIILSLFVLSGIGAWITCRFILPKRKSYHLYGMDIAKPGTESRSAHFIGKVNPDKSVTIIKHLGNHPVHIDEFHISSRPNSRSDSNH